MKYNLGTTTDDFNNEHAKFLKNYFIDKNVENLPFHFDYISYKKGTDILTESQQYKLCLDLLDAGYEVYVSDNPHIIKQVEGLLTNQYGDRIHFGEPPEKIKTFAIKL